MLEFRGKVAVITGAASGMGRAFADRFAREGMKIVLADVEEGALAKAVSELKAQGHDATGIRTDVSNPDSVQRLADEALAAYGKVHLLCANAGVSAIGGSPWTPLWRATLKDWQWVTGVNYWGVAHSIRVIVPLMLAHEEEGHVVITSSNAGLMPGNGVYGATKHAAVSMAESLYTDLHMAEAKIGVTCLCPLAVSTRLNTSDRNRPSELIDGTELKLSDEMQALRQASSGRATPAAEVAEMVYQAVRDNQFYLLTGTGTDGIIRERMENILNRRNPSGAMRIPAWMQEVPRR
ncbi:MAG: SDR family NAD(P)-dependent oxidoreductase [Chloroflexota bacterium]|nr:SDR family NAD(P)-dependent oxidoreductase [Chloroflexota bacterium]